MPISRDRYSMIFTIFLLDFNLTILNLVGLPNMIFYGIYRFNLTISILGNHIMTYGIFFALIHFNHSDIRGQLQYDCYGISLSFNLTTPLSGDRLNMIFMIFPALS